MVQVSGYAATEYGEVLEVDIYIKDDGEPIITYTVDNVGERWESELEPYDSRLRRDY